MKKFFSILGGFLAVVFILGIIAGGVYLGIENKRLKEDVAVLSAKVDKVPENIDDVIAQKIDEQYGEYFGVKRYNEGWTKIKRNYAGTDYYMLVTKVALKGLSVRAFLNENAKYNEVKLSQFNSSAEEPNPHGLWVQHFFNNEHPYYRLENQVNSVYFFTITITEEQYVKMTAQEIEDYVKHFVIVYDVFENFSPLSDVTFKDINPVQV